MTPPNDPSPLSIDVDAPADGPTVVRLGGSATMDEAERLTAELRRVAGTCRGGIVLDLTGLDFICSMGLGALIVAHVTGQRHGCAVCVAAPQQAIREMLQTTRLNLIFPIHDSLDDALNA